MSSALSPALIAQIDHLVEKYEQGHNLVKIGQQILELLRSEGHVQRLTLPPKCVGVHPANRDGMGISARDCHGLLDDIIAIGFVSNRVHAVATEVCSDDQRLWNERLVSGAGGSLGECRGQELKALSLSASHTNFCLRILLDSVQHSGGEMTLDGRLSMECLRMKDAAFHEAATKGLTWDVIPKMVIDQWPCLPALIQQGGNVDVNRGEHELQLLRRLHQMYVDRANRGETTNLDDIKNKAWASKPPFASSLQFMWQFAMKFSGGSKAPMMEETEAFVMNHAKAKHLGESVWRAISEEHAAANKHLLTRWRHALLKTAYVHSLTASEVKRSLSNKDLLPRVVEANDLMLEVRMLLKNVDEKHLLSHDCSKAIGLFEVQLAQFVLGIKVPEGKDYKSTDAIANDVVKVLSHFTGATIPNRWSGEDVSPSIAASVSCSKTC